MRKVIILLCTLNSFLIFSQEQEVKPKDSLQPEKKDYGKLFGSFESNGQWYLNNKDKRNEAPGFGRHPNDPLRSNTYLQLNYNYKRLTVGIQGESYDRALLSYNPKFKKTNVGTWYANYKSKKLDITGGCFYEQFGNGLILRTWEDRALGINNALRGGRIKYTPTDYLNFTALYGRQRTGFDVANSDIYGFNTEIDLFKMLSFEAIDLSLGFSYVGRKEETTIVNPNFDELTSAYSGRLNIGYKSFYFSSEYALKTKDAIVINDKIDNNFIKPGSALLLNFGFSQKGLGIDATFRRIENMSFYSEREPTLYTSKDTDNSALTSYSYNDMIMNYIPSLTKQHHYNLANIYVYQAQQKVDFPDPKLQKAGEIGGQIDIFYNFKKGSALGGKTGTKVSFNASNWYNLAGTYVFYNPNSDYDTDFFGSKEKYFSDYNIEINKKVNDKLHTNFAYINQYYNGESIGGAKLVKTNIVAADAIYKFNKSQSVKVQGEHMWADADMHNWAGGTVEFYYNSRLSFYVSDSYNYGNLNKDDKTHFYNVGGTYTKGSARVAINYGKQRGGLICVGGVCRYVPENMGLGLAVNYAF